MDQQLFSQEPQFFLLMRRAVARAMLNYIHRTLVSARPAAHPKQPA
jgi:trehalose/maltose hydrolase-like predicted phosphorylase